MSNGRPRVTTGPAVRVRGLTRRYREGGVERLVLDGVELALERGQSLALLGRSGAGKSTLLNLLGGIDLPDEGSVEIAGVSLASLSDHERTLFRRRHIGFVYQFFNLIPTLTVEENILLPLELNGRTEPKRVAELLHAVGLRERGHAFPDQLSGGEQQRVALARAVSHGPSLILADEPTGNLDERTGAQVIALLQALVRTQGVTLIIVTHSPEVSGTCDRLLYLEGGRVRAGPPEP